MTTQDTNEKVVSPKKQVRKKKGLNYLLLAIGCLVVSFILYSGGIEGGIFAIVNLAVIIFFVGGLIYLIMGFFGKE